MTKRKASIFTVIEAVPNWFEANQDIVAVQEATHVTVPTYEGTSPVEPHQARETLALTAETSHTWASSYSHTWKSAEVAEDEVIRAEGRQPGTGWAEPSGSEPKWAECDSVPWTGAGILEAAPDWAEVNKGELELADVADPSIRQPIPNVDPVAEGGTSEGVEATQEAFWTLLRAAGYEVW